jgi:hypothetical protein
MTFGFRRLYGSNPLHLIGHLMVFAVAGFAIVQILDADPQVRLIVLDIVRPGGGSGGLGRARAA